MRERTSQDPRIAAIIERQRRENLAAEAYLSARREQALREAARLALAIGESDGEVRRVILFGSLLPGRNFGASSDIDLVVEGGDYAGILRLAEDSPFAVDIIPYASLRSGLAQAAADEGKVLYEKKS